MKSRVTTRLLWLAVVWNSIWEARDKANKIYEDNDPTEYLRKYGITWLSQSYLDICVSQSTEFLSGGLVLSGWAGMMVTRIVLMNSCRILVTGGSISAPPST